MSSVAAPEIELDEPEDEVVWEDEAVSERSPVESLKPPMARKESPEDLAAAEIENEASKPAPLPRAKRKAPVADRSAASTRKVELEPRSTLVQRVRANRNPLIFAAVGLLVVGTIVFRTWRARIADLPRIAELGKTEGLTALDEGKFTLAHQLLSEAKRAVISLGDAYEGASAIKQGADEAAVIANFSPASLEEMIEEAARADPKVWEKKFADFYKGRSILIDSEIVKAPDSRGIGRYEFRYRVLPDGGDGETPRTKGRVDTPGFRLFDLTHPKVRDRVIFGARLASFQFDAEAEEWVIGLDPSSGVYMTHEKALRAMGWPDATENNGGEAAP